MTIMDLRNTMTMDLKKVPIALKQNLGKIMTIMDLRNTMTMDLKKALKRVLRKDQRRALKKDQRNTMSTMKNTRDLSRTKKSRKTFIMYTLYFTYINNILLHVIT